jgi:hypothetical protein
MLENNGRDLNLPGGYFTFAPGRRYCNFSRPTGHSVRRHGCRRRNLGQTYRQHLAQKFFYVFFYALLLGVVFLRHRDNQFSHSLGSLQ